MLDKIIAHYPCDDGLLIDSVSKRRAQTIGSPTSTTGKVGQAKSFANGSYENPKGYSIPHHSGIDQSRANAFGIHLWFKVTQAAWSDLLSKGISTSRDFNIGISFGGKISFYGHVNNSSTPYVEAPENIPLNTWNRLYCYWEMTEETTTTGIQLNDNPLVTLDSDKDYRFSTNAPLLVASFSGLRYSGEIDQLTFFNQTLTSQEIIDLYADPSITVTSTFGQNKIYPAANYDNL